MTQRPALESPTPDQRHALGVPLATASRLRLSLRARETAALILLTLSAVALSTVIHLLHTREILWEATLNEAELMARQIYAQSAHALSRGGGGDPWARLSASGEIRAILDASVGYAPWLLYALIADESGVARVHSDAKRQGEKIPAQPRMRALVAASVYERLRALYGGPQIYEVVLPFDLDRRPFGTIRLGIALPLLRAPLEEVLRYTVALGVIALIAALAVGLALSRLTLRPIRQLAEDMERLRQGDFDVGGETSPRDEFGKLAYQLQLLGRQMQSDRTRALTERSRFQSAADQLEDGIMLLSGDGRVLFANRAMEAAIGRPASQVVGEALNDALPADNPLRPLVDRALGGEGSRNVSFEIRSGDAPVQLVASAFPVMDPRETCDGAIVVLRDLRAVAVSPRAFQSLIQYSAQLAALGQVTAEVTHDVKNPLHAMVIHVAFLKERLREGPDDVRRSLDTLDREIRRADSLVSRFQHVIRQDEISLKPLQLNAVLEEIANALDAQWTARGVTIALTLDPGLPPVAGDEEMLRRAFMNVVLNACQAMPDGGRVSIVSERADEGTGRFTVTDEGMGVAAADLEKIFLPYYTTKAGGSGIGLPLVRRVVEMHHGEIEVRSTVGQGTTVIIRLPLHTGP